MSYRDTHAAIAWRVGALRAEVTSLRARPETQRAVELQAEVRRRRGKLASFRRRAALLRHPFLRLVPRSFTELLAAGVLAYVAMTATLGLTFIVMVVSRLLLA
jgi:hypothetical protein